MSSATVATALPKLSGRDRRWVLKRCARRGHVLAHLDDTIAVEFQASGPDGPLLRCLRCGSFVDLADPATPTGVVLGTPEARTPLGDVPLVLRGSHGRKLALLRVLAVERGGRGLLLLLAAAGIARLSNSHVAAADALGRLARAAEPLGKEVGWDVLRSRLLAQAQSLLGHNDQAFTTVAWLVGAYGVLQLVEGVGLWGGWRWAEYLAVIATSAFIPLEIYELWHHATVFKAAALAVNVVAVAYLVVKGRLFGLWGGHAAYLAEVRDATLLAEALTRAERPTTVLSSHEMR